MALKKCSGHEMYCPDLAVICRLQFHLHVLKRSYSSDFIVNARLLPLKIGREICNRFPLPVEMW